MWSLKTFTKIGCFVIINFILFFSVLFSFENKIGTDNKYYESDIKSFPKQPFNTYSNLAFSISSSVILGLIKYDNLSLFMPYLYLGVINTLIALASGVYHGTNDYGLSGRLDVALIPPYLFTVFWLELWTLIVAVKYFSTFHNILPCYTPNKETYIPQPPSQLNLIPILGNILLFFGTYFEVVDLTWSEKYVVFSYLIIGLVLFSIPITIYITVRQLIINFDINWKLHISLACLSLFSIIILIIVAQRHIHNHGIISHIVNSFLTLTLATYNSVIFNTILKK